MSEQVKIDPSRAQRKPAFTVPPSAKAAGLKGTPPLPPGKPMVLRKPSPSERGVLEQFGWKDGDPVPENLAELIATTTDDATNLSTMPPPVDLKTPRLKIPTEVQMADMPEVERRKYEVVLGALSEAKVQKLAEEELRGAMVDGKPELNAAIRTAAGYGGIELDVSDDTEEDTYASGLKKEEDKKHEHDSTYCPHCGWQQDIKDVVTVTETDKVLFLETLLGLQPFEKTFEYFDGRLLITVRTLLPTELDACFRQLVADNKEGKFLNRADEAEQLARYRTGLQIVSVIGPGLNKVFPRTYEGWKQDGAKDIADVWDIFSKEVDSSETMHKFLLGSSAKLNQLTSKLETNCENPDFWKAIG